MVSPIDPVLVLDAERLAVASIQVIECPDVVPRLILIDGPLDFRGIVITVLLIIHGDDREILGIVPIGLDRIP